MQIASTYAASALIAPKTTAAPPQAAPQVAPKESAAPARAPGDLFAEIAAKYDLRSMTPREIDAFAEELPESDIEAKMMILTRGEKFQRGLAKVVGEATGVDHTAAVEERLKLKIDLIGDFQSQLSLANAHGQPTEALERVVSYLQGIEARRHIPAGGVTV